MSAESDKYTGRRISKGDAALVGELLKEIETETGPLTTTETAEELINRCRPANSRGHHLFTWDDQEAGKAYRLDEARDYIRAVYVVFKELPEQKPVRAFVNVTHNGKRGPMSMRRVLTNADLVQQMLEKALEDLQTWQARYESLRKLTELRHVFGAVDRAVNRRSKKKYSKSTQQSARA